jgi:hypothetical protein
MATVFPKRAVAGTFVKQKRPEKIDIQSFNFLSILGTADGNTISLNSEIPVCRTGFSCTKTERNPLWIFDDFHRNFRLQLEILAGNILGSGIP